MEYKERTFIEIDTDVFCWPDTVNVYVIRRGEKAILIDVGSGSVFPALERLGVRQVDWVLLTQHQREHTQGLYLTPPAALIMAPGDERDLFLHPEAMRAKPGTRPLRYTANGAVYIRPPVQPVRVDVFTYDGQRFTWQDLSIEVYHTPGASPGGVTYVLTGSEAGAGSGAVSGGGAGGRRLAFCGALCQAGATLHWLFDSEWDYGYALGFETLLTSIHLLRLLKLTHLCPAHGPVDCHPDRLLSGLADKLERFIALMLRDRSKVDLAVSAPVSVPTASPGLRQISEHLFSFRTVKRHNAYILTSDTGSGLFIDCGIFLPRPLAAQFIDEKLSDLKNLYGLHRIEAVIVTHYHGDHISEIPHLTAKYGTEVWTTAGIARILRSPELINLSCTLPHYVPEAGPIAVARLLHDSEEIRWHEYTLKAHYLPGQTEFSLGISGWIDGRRVAFVGDNMVYNPDGNGHDAYVMYNSGGVLERGYIVCAERLQQINPDLILGGHAQEIPDAAAQVEKLKHWSHELRETLGELSAFEAYEYSVDPFWARLEPFNIDVVAGTSFPLTFHIRNYLTRPATFAGELRLPAGWRAEPESWHDSIPAGETYVGQTVISVPSGATGLGVVTVDITFNGRPIGEFAETRAFVCP